MNKCTLLFVCLLLCFARGRAQAPLPEGNTGSAEKIDSALVDSVINAAKDERQQQHTDEDDSETEVDYQMELPPDTILYVHSAPNIADSLGKLKKHKDFAYITVLDSLLRDQAQKKKKMEELPVPDTSPSFLDDMMNSFAFKLMMWALAIGFVGIIVFQLLKGNGLFSAKNTVSPVADGGDDAEVLMAQNDFDGLIAAAVHEGNYRLAIRYHFIKALQLLRDKNFIQYQADKTNSRYVYELPAHLRSPFSKLVLPYEYAWYGHFEITGAQYESLRATYESFYQTI